MRASARAECFPTSASASGACWTRRLAWRAHLRRRRRRRRARLIREHARRRLTNFRLATTQPLGAAPAWRAPAHAAGQRDERRASGAEPKPRSVQTRQVPEQERAAASAERAAKSAAAAQAAAAAFALAQEDRRQASKLNAELCRDFAVGSRTDAGGSFSSPNFPGDYPLHLSCTRLIEAPPGMYIVLDFRDHFHIEHSADCENDRIEIRDGAYGYSKILAKHCGASFPAPVRSSDQNMWLRFVSDGSIAHAGFKAVYRFEKQKKTKPMPPFDKLIDYTKEHNVPLECIWNITVTPGWKIYLTFSNYEINKPNDCDSNFIEIYEENLTEENQTVKFCGTRTEPQQSKSNVFNVRHHALPNASGSRFDIVYTAFREKGSGGCDEREFDCDDGTCIHESLKCDGVINCKYRYDEASDTGPCHDTVEQPFFETEHMVIILIVFLLLVGAMFASIVVSCWGKIQERRRRKLEYHLRKSNTASLDGQLNRTGAGRLEPQLSALDETKAGAALANALKQRLVSLPVGPAPPPPPPLAEQLYSSGSAAAAALAGEAPAALLAYNQQQQQQQRSSLQLARRQQLMQQHHSDSNDTSGSQNTSAGRFFAQPPGAKAPILTQPTRFVSSAQRQQHFQQVSAADLQQQQLAAQHSLRRQLTLDAQQRAPQPLLTMSAMHRPPNEQQQQQLAQVRRNAQSIYAFQPLSSSVTCCNLLGAQQQQQLQAELAATTEAPLIGDLLARAKLQQQQPPAAELRATTLARQHQLQVSLGGQRLEAHSASMPRSLSAHQLSKRTQMLQQNQQVLRAQQHQRAIQAQHQSLSYPHSCAQGSHQQDSAESQALPPPPPPPNLVQVRSATSCAALPSSARLSLKQQQQQQQQASQDSRRAAFRHSRLEASQLTGDTLPDSELLMPLHLDDLSTESDATFGMLVDSVGGQAAGLLQVSQAAEARQMQQQQQQQQMMLRAGQLQQAAAAAKGQPRQLVHLSHLGECNLARAQQPPPPAQALVYDCGPLERGQIAQQQQQFASSGLRYAPTLNGAPSFSRYRQQSSELTADEDEGQEDEGQLERDDGEQDDDEEDEDVELELDHLSRARYSQPERRLLTLAGGSSGVEFEDDDEEDEDEEYDDNAGYALGQQNSVIARKQRQTIVSRNEQPLREELQAKSKLHGSHTSLGCQSCTCGTAAATRQPLDNKNATDSSEANKEAESAANPSGLVECQIGAKNKARQQQANQPQLQAENANNDDNVNRATKVMENCDKQIAGSTT